MNLPLSFAKRKYKKNYVEKRKTDSGEVRIYSEEHVKQRWKKKIDKIQKLEKGMAEFRKRYKDHLSDDNSAKTRAIAACVGLIDNTAMRVGNEESAQERSTYGATTLRKKHAKVQGNKIRFKFVGKSGVNQDVVLDDKAVVSEIKKLLKGKKDNDLIFEYEEGKTISPKIINNYLKEFEITAKDIRGHHANFIMKQKLKKTKDFDKALEETADKVGHEAKTLMNQYLDPSLVKKYKKDGKNGKDKKKDKKKKANIPLAYKTANPKYKAALEAAIDDILGAEKPAIVPLNRKSPGAPADSNELAGGQKITSHFGPRIDPITGKKGATHGGVDLKAKTGTEILSFLDGVVGAVSEDSRSGKFVAIRHEGGFSSSYSHLSHQLVVPGQKVKQGEVIGLAGQTGRATGPHLHFRLNYKGKKIDPEPYLSKISVIGQPAKENS